MDQIRRPLWSSEFVHPVYSNSKMVTAATFMAAVVAPGLGGLDQPLSQSLPKLFDQRRSQGGKVTPRMIMSHTSSFTPISDLATTDRCYANMPSSKLYAKHRNVTLDECVYWLASDPVAMPYTPGTQQIYSGSAWSILAKIIEELTEQSFEEAFQKHIAKPLKMHSSTYICADVDLAAVTMSIAVNPKPANGLCSTATDFGRFVDWIFSYTVPGRNPALLLPRELVFEIMSPQAGLADQTEFFNEIDDCGRCVNRFAKSTNQKCFTGDSLTQATSTVGYGFGLELGAGTKTILLQHPATNGVTTIIAPGRFAVHISQSASHYETFNAYQGAVDALELANSFAVNLTRVEYKLPVCPTYISRAPEHKR